MIEFRDLEVVQLMVMTLVVYDFGNRSWVGHGIESVEVRSRNW